MEIKTIKTITIQVGGRKDYDIHFINNAYRDFEYMNDIKFLKKHIRFAIEENVYDRNGCVSRHSFISSTLNNPTYIISRLNEFEFIVKGENE